MQSLQSHQYRFMISYTPLNWLLTKIQWTSRYNAVSEPIISFCTPPHAPRRAPHHGPHETLDWLLGEWHTLPGGGRRSPTPHGSAFARTPPSRLCFATMPAPTSRWRRPNCLVARAPIGWPRRPLRLAARAPCLIAGPLPHHRDCATHTDCVHPRSWPCCSCSEGETTSRGAHDLKMSSPIGMVMPPQGCDTSWLPKG
jgi:hypothetical protein